MKAPEAAFWKMSREIVYNTGKSRWVSVYFLCQATVGKILEMSSIICLWQLDGKQGMLDPALIMSFLSLTSSLSW